MTGDLIKRLRDGCECQGDSAFWEVDANATDELLDEAADALEAKDKRIAELEGCVRLHQSATSSSGEAVDGLVSRIAELEWQRDNNIRGCQCSEDEACAHVRRAEKAEADLETCEIMLEQERGFYRKADADLGNLLAAIHRDGGHYQAEHGTKQAVDEAHHAWASLISRAEKAERHTQTIAEAAAKVEADLAAAQACIRWFDGADPEFSKTVRRDHESTIAAARGDQPSPVKSCETCAKKLIPTGCQDGDPALCWATHNSAWSSVDGMGPSGPMLQDRVRDLDDEQPDPCDQIMGAFMDALDDLDCRTCKWGADYESGVCMAPSAGHCSSTKRELWKPKSDVCPTCEGERTISVKAANGFCSFRRTCPDCGGTGRKETK